MAKGWLPVLEVGSSGAAGRVGPRGLNHLHGLSGNGAGERKRSFSGELSLGGIPRKEV